MSSQFGDFAPRFDKDKEVRKKITSYDGAVELLVAAQSLGIAAYSRSRGDSVYDTLQVVSIYGTPEQHDAVELELENARNQA